MNLFRIRGIQLAIHASFLPLLAYVAYEGWSAAAGHDLPAHWPELGWALAYVALLFTCVTLHELGHCLTAQYFGVNVPRILLLPIGGVAEFDSIPQRPREEMLVAIAGPAVNGLLAAVFMTFAYSTSNWDPTDFPDHGVKLLQHLVFMNIAMGAFNLLPIFPMDGGRILRAFFVMRMPYGTATRRAVIIGKVLAVAGAFMMIFYAKNYLGGALFAFIFLAGEIEWRAVKKAEREAACWEDVPARLNTG